MFKILPQPEPIIDSTYAPISGNEEGSASIWVPDEEAAAIDALVKATLEENLPDITDLFYCGPDTETSRICSICRQPIRGGYCRCTNG